MTTPRVSRTVPPKVLAAAEANMYTILAALRATGYTGTLVIVNYYSTDYSDQFVTELVAALNQAITAPASAYGAVVADVFSAFQAAVSNPFAAGNAGFYQTAFRASMGANARDAQHSDP